MTERKVIRAKVGLLELAKQLGNVTQACRVLGYIRGSFCRFRNLFERGGELALADMTKARPNLRNRVVPEVEAAVIERAVEQPSPRRRRARSSHRTAQPPAPARVETACRSCRPPSASPAGPCARGDSP
mgnify:CR=1 FL=1